MRTRIICDSCRQVFVPFDLTYDSDLEQVDGLVTLSGLCPDCSRALQDKEIEP